MPTAARLILPSMSVAPDDWRRTGQEEFLLDATLTWNNYQALSAEWEHEHCEFCFHKFLDAHYSSLHADALASAPDEQSPAGYTNLPEEGRPAGKWWICATCFNDFKEEFRWKVEEADPAAWPYERPEPTARPTAADFNRPDGRFLPRPE
jgi:hypothetical protein